MKKFFLFGLSLLVLSASATITWKTLNKQFKMRGLLEGNVIALAQNEGGGYSCTVTYNCQSMGTVTGEISCTGSTCKRGTNLIGTPYVECDGHRTTC